MNTDLIININGKTYKYSQALKYYILCSRDFIEIRNHLLASLNNCFSSYNPDDIFAAPQNFCEALENEYENQLNKIIHDYNNKYTTDKFQFFYSKKANAEINTFWSLAQEADRQGSAAYKIENEAKLMAHRNMESNRASKESVGIFTKSLASYLLYETVATIHDYEFEKKLQRQYEKDKQKFIKQMGLYSSAQAVEMNLIINKMMPAGKRTIEKVVCGMFEDIIDWTREKQIITFDYNKIEQEHRMLPDCFGVNNALIESNKLLENDCKDDNDRLIKALIKCPYNIGIYNALIEANICITELKHCAVYFGICDSLESVERKINDYNKNVSDYKERCIQYNDTIDTLQQEYDNTKKIHFFKRKDLSNKILEEKNNFKTYKEERPIIIWD